MTETENLTQQLYKIYEAVDKQIEGGSEKDFNIRLSQLAQHWDNGLSLASLGSRKGKPSQPYSQVDYVWICVNLLIDVASSLQLMISTSDDQVVESGPAIDFLFNNDQMNWSEFLESTIGYYALFREVYWIYADMDLKAPKKIIVVGPTQMSPVVKKGVLLAYKMRQGNQELFFDVDEVHCVKNFNPYDPHRGCGPLNAGDMTISTAFQAVQYTESSLANGGRLSTILSTPPGSKLAPEEELKLKKQFQHEHRGARNAAKVFLANGGLEVSTLSQSMADLQMAELQGISNKTICALFGVPGECVGLNSEAQYAHGPATARLVMFGAGPLLSTMAEHIDAAILDRFKFRTRKNRTVEFDQSKRYCGSRQKLQFKTVYKEYRKKAIQSGKQLFAWFDIDSHWSVQDMIRDKIESYLKLVEKGVTLNQVIRAADLPFEELPHGDHYWISMGQQPAQWILDAGPEAMNTPPYDPNEKPDEEDKPDEEQEDKELSIDNRPSKIENREKANRIWQSYTASWAPIEKQYIAALRPYFIRQGRELKKKLRDNYKQLKELRTQDSEPGSRKTKLRIKDEQLIAKIVFDLVKENGKLKVINQTFFEKAADLGAAQIHTEAAGVTGADLIQAAKQTRTQPVYKKALATSSHKITSVNKTTQSQIARTLREGLDQGQSLPELEKRIDAVLGGNRAKAQRIARTQTSGAIGTGRFAAIKKLAAKLKSWLTAGDETVRPTHKAAQAKYAKGIPVDQPFVVNGESLMYPADPAGSAANIINCRCALLAKYGSGKKQIDYANIKFLTWNEYQEYSNAA